MEFPAGRSGPGLGPVLLLALVCASQAGEVQYSYRFLQTPSTSNGLREMGADLVGLWYPEIPKIVHKFLAKPQITGQLHFWPTCEKWKQSKDTARHDGGAAGRRRKRAVALNFLNHPLNRWPLGEPIHYHFDDRLSDALKPVLVAAFDEWQSKTCLTFTNKLPSNQGTTYLHMLPGTGCISFVGKGGKDKQEFYVSSSCLAMKGNVLKSIGNSLGLWDETQHPYRDNFINFITDNINPYDASNFISLEPDLIDTQEIPFDYTSVMMFHQRIYAKAGATGRTLETIDPLFQRAIGQKVEVNFNDAKLINKLYCASDCASYPRLVCLNSGYQDPKDCSRCRCPDGFTGTTCKDFQGATHYIGDPCGGTLWADGTEQEITSPNYNTGSYNQNQYCVWIIKASNPAKQIDLWFDHDFGVSCTANQACQDWVELRLQGNLYEPGPRWCCNDLHVDRLQSKGNTVIVIFKALFEHSTPEDRRGFRLYFTSYPRDPAPACSQPCYNGGSCIVSNCVCAPGFTGSACENDIDDCAEPRCFNGGRCVDGVDSFTCDCTSTGYTGATCTQDVDECESNPCQHGGTCLNAKKMYVCDCRRGYTGDNCETDINECDSQPCENGGRCEDLVNGYLCDCPTPYTGDHCQTATGRACDSSPCQNNGTCSESTGSPAYVCQCPAPFSGTDCEMADCGGCNVMGGERQDPCIDPSSTETMTVRGKCTRIVKKSVRSYWGRTRVVYVCEYYSCIKTIPVQTCCQNAALIEEGTRLKCAAKGWTDWRGCSGTCGGCGVRRRFKFDLVTMISDTGEARNYYKCVDAEAEPCGFKKCKKCEQSGRYRYYHWLPCQSPCCDGYVLAGEDTCVPDKNKQP